MTLRRTALSLLATTATLAACGDGGGTAPSNEVADVLVSPPSATLDEVGETLQFSAEPVNEDGGTVSGVTLEWSSSNLTVATVDPATGLATAVGDGTAFIMAEADGVTGSAELAVEIVGLQVSSPTLNNGRLTLPYAGTVEAKGGAGGYTFEVTSGSLPTGLDLESDGDIVGTPTELGTSSFTVQVTDAESATATRTLSLEVCEVPEAFDVGESRALAPPAPGACGVFLPSGADHRYRVALIRTNTNESANDIATLTLTVDGNGVAAAAPPEAAARAADGPRLQAPPAALRRSLEIEAATRTRHEELRRQEREMLRAIGTDGLLPDLRRTSGPLRAAQAQPLPAKLRIDPTTPSSCSPAGAEVTAIKIAENASLGIYQDSTQNAAAGTRVTAAEAQALLDFYADHGKPVVDAYFGGVSDVDGNGKVVVFISPVVSGNTAAFVWSGDFFTTAQCPASNAMEIIFFSQSIVADLDDPDVPAQGLETLVHEMKHVSSLYQRVQRSQAMGTAQFHPVWWEEGVAEIAGGVASRAAWAAQGGPAVTDMLDEDDWRAAVPPGESLTDDAQFGVLLRLWRTQGYLASQPNGLVVTPVGSLDLHSVYGSGWVFGRWIGDGFGEAASAPLAEAGLWAQMNDQDWPSGVAGLEQTTGLSWQELLERYALAVMVNGTGAPLPPQAFTTYDFPSAIELWCFAADNPPCDPEDPGPAGAFPWPVTTSPDGNPSRSFGSDVYEGPAGSGGIRIFDFVSDGSGAGAEIHALAPAASRMVVVRIN